ncbi:MAG: type IV pilin N-terminal domain-containing protein [Candidatus Thermoplasmatota archaeon]|nr:type IV pilin N-terminal domain-containing protein [Candidatus Thermoplasmatota archaeon]
MKANRKFIEADERAVSAVIGVILMVAITVAIAATVYVYVSGMIGGTKNQTPNVACTTDSTSNRVTIATADANIRWSDVRISLDTAVTSWSVYTSAGTSIGYNQATTQPFTGTQMILAGDYLLLNGTVGNVKVTFMYAPTNSLLGSWTVNV